MFSKAFKLHDWSSKGYVYVLDIALVCGVLAVLFFSEISLWYFEYFGGFPFNRLGVEEQFENS